MFSAQNSETLPDVSDTDQQSLLNIRCPSAKLRLRPRIKIPSRALNQQLELALKIRPRTRTTNALRLMSAW